MMPPYRATLGVVVACVLGVGPLAAARAWAQGTAPGAPSAEPLSLEQAIATALKSNPRVRQAEENLRAARAVVKQARAADDATAQIEVVHSRVSEVPEFTIPVPAPPPQYIGWQTITVGRERQTQGTLTLSQPLYTGGRVEAAVRQASAGARARAEEATRTLQSVVNDVKQAYFAVLLAAELASVAEQTVGAAREHLRVAQAHFEAGTAPRFDVLRAETRVAESEQALIQARNGLELARAALNNAMGVPQDAQWQLTTGFEQPAPPPGDLGALIAQAEAARPELRQVQGQITAASAAIELARAEKRPTLGAAWIYNRVLDTSAFQVTNWTLAVQGTLLLFNGAQTSAAVARAARERESARALLEQVRQGVALQVRQAYLNLGSARERIVAAAKAVEQAEEAHRIATVRYNAGVSISVEVIDAQVALSAARSDHARAVYDYNIALAQLEYAIAAWQPAPEATAPIFTAERPQP